MFHDIRQKGATRNYNTKPNEKANGPLKKYYQFRTNFKNVAPQVFICLVVTTQNYLPNYDTTDIEGERDGHCLNYGQRQDQSIRRRTFHTSCRRS